VSEKTAIVTGASSGLGRALVLELLKEGYAVALVGRNEKKLKELAQENDKAKVVVADLTKEDDMRQLYPRCKSELRSPVNLLVNCAGMAVTGRIQDIPRDAYEYCWKVNYLSTVQLIQAALPDMIERNTGMIVNVSSGVGRRALPFASPYCSAKAALNSFTDSLRVEVSGTGIKILNFAPGPVESNFHDSQIHYGTTELHFPPFHGVDAGAVAHKLFQAIQSGRRRVVLGFRANIAHHMNYWSPGFTDRVVAKMYKVEKTEAIRTKKRA
jgi:short-subunit dehydrogenase